MILVFSLIFNTCLPEFSLCQEACTTFDPDESLFESAKRDFGNWPDRIWEDSIYTFTDNGNLMALLLAGGGSIAMHNTSADDTVARNMENTRTFDNNFFDEGLNIAGCPGIHFAATGIWYAIAHERGDQLNQDRAWTMMTALAITGMTTLGLKALRNNDTPNGKSWAWPSGHTSSSFAVASVLDEFYGPRIGIPAYAAASVIGWRMMDVGDHWASDVLFGATLGWVVGHSVAGKHKKVEIAGWRVTPYFGNYNVKEGTCMGFSLSKQF